MPGRIAAVRLAVLIQQVQHEPPDGPQILQFRYQFRRHETVAGATGADGNVYVALWPCIVGQTGSHESIQIPFAPKMKDLQPIAQRHDRSIS